MNNKQIILILVIIIIIIIIAVIIIVYYTTTSNTTLALSSLYKTLVPDVDDYSGNNYINNYKSSLFLKSSDTTTISLQSDTSLIQDWYIAVTDNINVYTIQDKTSLKYLTYTSSGTQLQLLDNNNQDSQKWIMGILLELPIGYGEPDLRLFTYSPLSKPTSCLTNSSNNTVVVSTFTNDNSNKWLMSGNSSLFIKSSI